MSVFRQLRGAIIRGLPEPVSRSLRDVRKRFRREAWKKRVRENPDAVFGQSDVVEALRSLGVEEGRDLIVHSAMSKIGMLESGADTVIDGLIEVIGPKATLVMPAYPMRASMLETMRDPTPFRVGKDRSYMGKLTEVFRQRQGTLRSAHPTHSVAALGPSAEFYVGDHHRSGSPCGSGSPFMRLWENDGQILCIGTGVGKVTSHHVIEDRLESFPMEVYMDEILSKDVEFSDGRIEKVEVRVHRPELSRVRVDNDASVEAEILACMRTRQIVREGPLGLARTHLFGARDLDAMLEQRLQDEGTTIYRL